MGESETEVEEMNRKNLKIDNGRESTKVTLGFKILLMFLELLSTQIGRLDPLPPSLPLPHPLFRSLFLFLSLS